MDPASPAESPSASRSMRPAAWLLLALGLLGHLVAAHAMGGSRTAYVHHVLGFAVILLVTGGVVAGLGYRYLRSRPALALLLIALVQALLGVWVAVQQLRDAAGA